MKTVRGSAVLLLFGLTSVASVRADTDTDSNLPESNVRESSLYDPDAGINERPEKKAQNPGALAAAQQQQRTRNEQEQSWLLLGYEAQMQARNANTPKDENKNLYYQISTDKDLAKLAGLTVFDLNNSGQTMQFHQPEPDKNVTTPRPDLASQAGTPSAPHSPPLTVKPLGWASSDYVSLHNSFATPTEGSLQQFVSHSDVPTVTPPQTAYVRQNSDPTALDTPGMTAAENDPVMGRSATPLTLDLLPDESVSAAKAREENLTLLQAPKGSNVSQLQSLEASATRPPAGVKTAPPVPLNPVLFKLQYEDPPVTAPPAPPIRTTVDDPMDTTFLH